MNELGLGQGMKIMFMASTFDGSPYYRMYLPSMYLRTIKGVQSLFSSVTSEDIVWQYKPDVLVLQWQYSAGMAEAIRRFRAKGIKVIFDIDDDVWSIPLESEGVHFGYWTEEKIKGLEQVAHYSTAITVSTWRLKQIVEERQLHHRVYVRPNYIDLQPLKDLKKIKRKPDDAIRIGWHGGASHSVDFTEDIVEALKEASKRNGVELIFFGYVPDALVGRVRYIKGVQPIDFMKTLYSLSLDLGLVISNPAVKFNESKSPIKLLEHLACRTLVIASKVLPYEAFSRCERVYEHTKDAWLDVLSDAVVCLKEEKRQEEIQSNFEYVQSEWPISRNKYIILNTIQECIG